MSERSERPTKVRRAEQDVRGYSTSSRWYTTLCNAIEYPGCAETATTPKERFTVAWSHIYNLFMLYVLVNLARGLPRIAQGASTDDPSRLHWLHV